MKYYVMKKTASGVIFLEMDKNNTFKKVSEKKVRLLKSLIDMPQKKIIVYWMRHCQSCANIKYKLNLSRHLETPSCTQEGLATSLVMGKRLVEDEIDFDQVLCSPLPRAMMTAYFVSKKMHEDTGSTDITVIPYITEKTSVVNNFTSNTTVTANTVSFKECKNWAVALSSLKTNPLVTIDINAEVLKHAYNGRGKENFLIKGDIKKDYSKFLKDVLLPMEDSTVLIVSHRHYITSLLKPFELEVGHMKNNGFAKIDYYVYNNIIVAANVKYDNISNVTIKEENLHYADKYLKKLKIYDCKHYYSNSSGIENNKSFQIKPLLKMSKLYKNID